MLAVACASVCTIVARQTADVSAEPKMANELTFRVFGSDRSWQWVGAIDNRPGPIVPSEKRVLVGIWQRVSGGPGVFVSIYVVDSVRRAHQWLAVHATGAKDWTIRRYQVGDGAWRAEHPNGQVHIALRRRSYVITVGSKDAVLAERCAREIVLYLDAI